MPYNGINIDYTMDSERIDSLVEQVKILKEMLDVKQKQIDTNTDTIMKLLELIEKWGNIIGNITATD